MGGEFIAEEQLLESSGFQACVLSFFDGMTAHHQQILSHALHITNSRRDDILVILCYEKDISVTGTREASPCLLSLHERVALLKAMGYSNVLPWPFPAPGNMMHLSWPATPAVLKQKAGYLVPGADLWHNHFFKAFFQQEKQQNTWFSERTDETFRHRSFANPHEITEMVQQGRMEELLDLLGYAYPLTGRVVIGNMIGRTLGYPTANLKVHDIRKVLPGQGVYAAMVRVHSQWYSSMVNIGIRPTLDLHNVTIEAHLFDFHDDLYDQEITLGFLARIRDEMRFNSLSELKVQLDRDRENTLEHLQRLMPAIETNAFVHTGIRSS